MGEEAEQQSWDQYLENWLLSNSCYACAMANTEDGAFFAAAPTAGDKGWDHVFREPQVLRMPLEDGSMGELLVDEAAGLKQVMQVGKVPQCGLWFGGHKYLFRSFDEDADLSKQYSGIKLLTAMSLEKRGDLGEGDSRPCIVAADTGSVIVAAFTEHIGRLGKATEELLEFVEDLVGMGLAQGVKKRSTTKKKNTSSASPIVAEQVTGDRMQQRHDLEKRVWEMLPFTWTDDAKRSTLRVMTDDGLRELLREG